ncbi:MAG: DUF4402 domain-containing protein [Phenylobacterium sp.]
MALGLVLVLATVSGAAHATSNYNVQVTTNADLGRVTSAASGDTVFRIDPTTGNVTITNAGGATRASNGTTRAMVTISCTGVAGDCNKILNIQLSTAGAPAGRGRALGRITFTMGTAVLAGGPGLPGSGAFSIAAIGLNSSKTFFVGADFGIAGDDSGLSTGIAEADFSVAASEAANPSGGPTGRFLATVLRQLSLTKTQDLVFGVVSTPTSGNGTVTIDPATGVRTTVGAMGFGTPTPSQALFSVTGEGGQALSVTIPSSFTMSGPQSMTVTTSNSAGATPALNGVLGSQGNFSFGVGGSIPVNSTTPNGSYTGNFTVMVAYN